MAFALNNPVSFNDPTGLAPSGLFPLAAFADYENEREKAGMLTAEDNGNGGEKKKEHKAWEKKRDWNQDDFGKFQDFVQKTAEGISSNTSKTEYPTIPNVFEQSIEDGYFQCSQLALFLLISYAKAEGLPLTLKNMKAGEIVEVSSSELTWYEFSNQTKNMSVSDIRLNSTPVNINENYFVGGLIVQSGHVNTIFDISNDGDGFYFHTINASGTYKNYNAKTGYGQYTKAHISGGADIYYRNGKNGKLHIWNVFINNYIKIK